MTIARPASTSTRPARPPGDGYLYVVRATDRVARDIAGHPGRRYSSPPQTLAEALALASLLVGAPVDNSQTLLRWTQPIAGGRRTVTIERADEVPLREHNRRSSAATACSAWSEACFPA